LDSIQSDVTADQAEYLSGISERLGLASDNLSTEPDLANEDLEVAWKLLIQGFPDSALTGNETTPTPTPTPKP
jgi:hypothetical protein